MLDGTEADTDDDAEDHNIHNTGDNIDHQSIAQGLDVVVDVVGILSAVVAVVAVDYHCTVTNQMGNQSLLLIVVDLLPIAVVVETSFVVVHFVVAVD